MSNDITTEHKGQTIEFQVFNEQWTWQGYQNPSLAKVVEYVDRTLPKRWEPTEAYNVNYSDEVERVTVRSAGADGSLWIQGNKRSEKAHRRLYVISEHNEECFRRIDELRKQRDELDHRINSIKNELQQFTVSDLRFKE